MTMAGTTAATGAPTCRAVGDCALVFEFGTVIDAAINARILACDAALAAAPPPGMIETVPAYAALMLVYDPLTTDPDALEAAARRCFETPGAAPPAPVEHHVPVCFDADLGPDLADAASALGLTAPALIDAFLGAQYRVFMVGFAPGYAYLGGVPPALHLPRKAVPVRRRPVGSVMIAGGQALVTTLAMPTGWWVIGASDLPILDPAADRPCRFVPGDRIRFEVVPRARCRVVS